MKGISTGDAESSVYRRLIFFTAFSLAVLPFTTSFNARAQQRGIFITQRAQSVNGIGSTIKEAHNASVSESPAHGRYFTRIGLDLFVYLDESQKSLGRDLFTKESGLFGPLSAWSVSRRMAIFSVDDETSLNLVEENLIGGGFEKRHASRDALEKGFKTGDTSPLIDVGTGRSKI